MKIIRTEVRKERINKYVKSSLDVASLDRFFKEMKIDDYKKLMLIYKKNKNKFIDE